MRASRLPSEQESRIEWWRQVVFRQQSAPVPLAQFCRQMGISYRKFSYWRRRLREMDAAGSGPRLTPSGSLNPASAAVRDTAAAFVPVSIVDRSATTALEIELANGCSVRLTGSIDPGLLRAAVIAAGELETRRRGDH
jgi:hypothetical protein